MGNVERHRTAHQAFNRREWEKVAGLTAEGCTYTDQPRGVTVKSRQEFVGWLKEWALAFSDAAVTDPTYYDAGDTTIAVFTGAGTNDGSLGSFPASNQRITWPLCEILNWQGGEIVSGELFYDQMTMLVQAGHIQPPPQQ